MIKFEIFSTRHQKRRNTIKSVIITHFQLEYIQIQYFKFRKNCTQIIFHREYVEEVFESYYVHTSA